MSKRVLLAIVAALALAIAGALAGVRFGDGARPREKPEWPTVAFRCHPGANA